MLETGAAQLFLFVASVCVVVLTILAGIIGVYLLRLVMELRSFLQKIRMEAERVSHARRAALGAVSRVGAWVCRRMH